MNYILIALALYSLIYLICGIFRIDDIPEPVHIAIAFCCLLWPIAVLLAMIIFILFNVANCLMVIGEYIRNIFEK